MTEPLRLAVLFWCYHALDLCEDRIRDLRARNPGVPIYVLFGGPLDQAPRFEAALGPLVDDFYAFTEDRTPYWKWYHGDLMIARWHEDRGRDLPFDSIFIAQWDLLLTAPLSSVCAGLEPDELMLPGLRPMPAVHHWWYWTRPGSPHRDEYRQFMESLAATTGFTGDGLGCQFVFACLPKRFLEAYATRPEPTLGFLEYTIPTCARAWGFRFRESRQFETRWRRDPGEAWTTRFTCTLSTEKEPVPCWLVELHRLAPNGQRIVHPYHYYAPRSLTSRVRRFSRSLARTVIDACKRPFNVDRGRRSA